LKAFSLNRCAARAVRRIGSPAFEKGNILKALKVLIADDDRDHLIMVAMMLRNEGYEVVSACDARQAIQVAVEQNPDVLLLDVHLGTEDGYSVQERLQKIPEMADKRVIYITGDQSGWVQCITAGLGANALIRKPFERSQLITTLKLVMEAVPAI
jgi:CheY-like chemotaxis protein